MATAWECPIEWQQATVGVEGVRQLVRAEVERALRTVTEDSPVSFEHRIAGYLSRRFPSAAPESETKT